MQGGRLRVIEGHAVAAVPVALDPWRFQTDCVEAYVCSWVARGFSPVTVETDSGVLERMLTTLGRPTWEVTAEDVDRVVGAMATDGKAAATRREYVQVFKGFHRFLTARKAAEIEAAFGVRLVACPGQHGKDSDRQYRRQVVTDPPRAAWIGQAPEQRQQRGNHVQAAVVGIGPQGVRD